jgi:pyridoxine 4-dehydrogenase
LNAESSRRDFFNSALVGGTTATSGLWLPSDTALAAENVARSIKLSPMGLGAWAWGDSVFWKQNKKEDEELRNVFDYAVEKTTYDIAIFV